MLGEEKIRLSSKPRPPISALSSPPLRLVPIRVASAFPSAVSPRDFRLSVQGDSDNDDNDSSAHTCEDRKDEPPTDSTDDNHCTLGDTTTAAQKLRKKLSAAELQETIWKALCLPMERLVLTIAALRLIRLTVQTEPKVTIAVAH